MAYTFAKPAGGEKLTRRAFIAAAILVPIGVKLGFAFAAEASDSNIDSQKPGMSAQSEKSRSQEFTDSGSPTGAASFGKVIKTTAEWKKQLTPEQYEITREAGTERPFANAYDKLYAKDYRCVCCGTALFSSDTS